MFSSIFLPMYNGIVFEVAVSHTKLKLLEDIHEWLNPDIFDVEVVVVILFEAYGQKDEDGMLSDIQQMPITWHVFRRVTSGLPER